MPYHDRGAIEAGALDGQKLEICWLKDPSAGCPRSPRAAPLRRRFSFSFFSPRGAIRF